MAHDARPTGQMLQFVRLHKQGPLLRPAETRRDDFSEIADDFDPRAAAQQASRCSQCGVPFCQVHCPLGNHIPDWLMLVSAGRLRDAWALSQRTNPMPEVCGRVCPQDRLCEGNCVLERSEHGTVTIGAVERWLTDLAFKSGWVLPLPTAQTRAQRVGIIGAGPAGLAAAERLRAMGYGVDVYDRHDRAGGLLMYGIPNFKLDKAIVERRVKVLTDGGVRLHLGVEVGKTLPFSALRLRHDALLVATGVYAARPLGIAGDDLPGVVEALDFLIAANRAGLGDAPGPHAATLQAKGKRVVVIGGGDTAMDCVRTAVRQGATEVTCVYRRDRANMPGSQKEVGYAEAEGVVFRWLSAPLALMGEGRVQAVRCGPVVLGPPDMTGRRQPMVQQSGATDLAADLVIRALGFSPENLTRGWDAPDLKATSFGTLCVDDTLQTTMPGVFAAGDIVQGASLVVHALRDGRDVAAQMHRYLQLHAPRS
jgi:glutamate synthase (NADPH/NADH) small chain